MRRLQDNIRIDLKEILELTSTCQTTEDKIWPNQQVNREYVRSARRSLSVAVFLTLITDIDK